MSESISCRLCLYNCTVYDDIYSEKMQNSEMTQKIAKYLYIEIKEDDEYTKNICNKCIERIDNFHLFSCQVTANQEILNYSTNTLNTDEQTPITAINDRKSELVQITQYSIKTENYIVTLHATTDPNTIDCTINPNNLQTVSVTPIINVDLTKNTNDGDGGDNDTMHVEPIEQDTINTPNDTGQIENVCNANDSQYLIDNTTINKNHLEIVRSRRTVPRKKTTAKKSEVEKIGMRKGIINKSNHQTNETKMKANTKQPTITQIEIVEIETEENLDEFNKSIETSSTTEILDGDCDADDDDGECYDSDASVDLSGTKLINDDDYSDSESIDQWPTNDNDRFAGFPKVMIKDSKLVIRGKQLFNLMSRFFRLECDLCNDNAHKSKETFKNLANLCSHYVEIHSIKGYVICCGIKLFKARTMAMHMSRHLQPEAFTCKKCDKIMTTPKILEFHLQNHLPEHERPLACPDCHRRFSYSSALKAHAISHQPEHERASHICDECGKSFLSPGRLSTHINVTHISHSQDYICHICARQFASRGNLSYHLTTHQPRITNQVQCSVKECGKWLKNKVCLRKHMNQHSIVRYHCEICKYSSLNRQCLKNHMKVQHSDVKPYSCETCGKTFKLRHTLMDHIAQHTGVRRFVCEFCERTFASSGNYYSHRKRMHPQELAAVIEKREEEERVQRNVMLAEKVKEEK